MGNREKLEIPTIEFTSVTPLIIVASTTCTPPDPCSEFRKGGVLVDLGGGTEIE